MGGGIIAVMKRKSATNGRVGPWAEVAIVVAILAVTTLAFSPLFGRDYEFINLDDDSYVRGNRHVQEGLTADGVVWAFTAFYSNNWHPLTWLSLQLDRAWFGAGPEVFHRTNVALHAASAVLLFLFLRWSTGTAWPSGVVAALFAVHPVRVESVAWIAERKDVLAGLFWMLTLLGYVFYTRRPGWRRYLLVVAAFALGLMAKPMLVTLPAVLLLLDVWPLGRTVLAPSAAVGTQRASLSWLLVEKLPLLLLAIASAAVTFVAQRAQTMSVEIIPLSFRLENALISYVRYIVKTLWPADLALWYPLPHAGYALGEVAGAGVLLAGLTALVLAQQRRPFLAVGWFWFVGALLPVIGLVQLSNQAMADRYTYLPQIGLLIALVWSVTELAVRWRGEGIALAAAGILIGFSTLFSWLQVHYWRTSAVLWAHTLDVTGENALAQDHLGNALYENGDIHAAAEHFREALRLSPYFADAHYNLGLCLLHDGKKSEARDHFASALRSNPRHAFAHAAVGALFLDADNARAAESHFEQAADVAPDYPYAFAGWGEALERQGRWAEAAERYRRAVTLQPQSVEYRCDLASALYELGDVRAAGEEYQRVAIFLKDGTWAYRYQQEAWALATNPDATKRNGPRAVHLARQASQANRNVEPQTLATLAAAYAEQGDFERAQKTARAALDVVKKFRMVFDTGEIEGALRLYEQRQPLRIDPSKAH